MFNLYFCFWLLPTPSHHPNLQFPKLTNKKSHWMDKCTSKLFFSRILYQCKFVSVIKKQYISIIENIKSSL